MKNQALFSSKDKSKKLKYRLLQFLFGALRVNHNGKSVSAVGDILHYKAKKKIPVFPVTRPTLIFFADPDLFFAGWGTFVYFWFPSFIVAQNFVARNFLLPTSNRSSAISVYHHTTRGALL